MPERKSFWTTLPGILTGIAATVTAITGLYLALVPGREPAIQPKEPTYSEQDPRRNVEVPECDERINKAWELVQAHRGKLTDAIDDLMVFQELVLDIGCLQHFYTIDMGG